MAFAFIVAFRSRETARQAIAYLIPILGFASAFVLISDGRNPKEGMDLLAKGREMNPNSWKIFFESGFVYYIAWQDVPKAALGVQQRLTFLPQVTFSSKTSRRPTWC